MRDGGRRVAKVRRLAVLTEGARNSHEHRDEERGERGGDRVPTVGPPRTDRHGREVCQRQDEELDACRDGDRAHQRDGERNPGRRLGDGAGEHREPEQEDRVGERLRHEVAVVDHRRSCDRPRCGEQCVRRPHDSPREPVRGKDCGGHHERVQQLGGRVGVRHRAEQPGRRLHERREWRGEEEVLPADRQAMTGRDRLGELRVEQLVVEDRRSRVSAGLQEVVRGRRHEQQG